MDISAKEEHQNEVMADDGQLPLSEDEERVLALFDRLQELQLEIALLKAQRDYKPSRQRTPAPRDIERAQDELLNSRATYTVRKDIVDSVMMANPILQAVHGGTNASPIEKDLLTYVEQRDRESISLAKQSSELKKVMTDLTKIQVESLAVNRRNVDLTSELLSLAEEANRRRTVEVDDPEMRSEIHRLEKELKVSRQRWKVMKGTASAVVAGSGVNWVEDPELRNMVLDPED